MTNSECSPCSDDDYLQHLIASRDISAVAKVQFAAYASACRTDAYIFAYEGPSDKQVYYHWIKRIDPQLTYEPYICKNKHRTLQLFDSLQTDLTGLGARVFYFVDNDYDGLQGRPGDSRIFLLDAYSIENLFVCRELLDDLLKIDFHCEGAQQCRDAVISLFETAYDHFLKCTRDLNFRTFLARKLRIRQLKDAPENPNEIAKITLLAVEACPTPLEATLPLEREPTPQEIDSLRSEFDQINPRLGYRGKYALIFLKRWLNLLREDRLCAAPHIFNGIAPATSSIPNNHSLQSLAPKAPHPRELPAFLSLISSNEKNSKPALNAQH